MMEESGYDVINNDREMQFEVHLNGEKAYLSYRFYKKDIAFMHTFVPESLGGKGIASAMAKAAFQYAGEHKKPVMVYCPYVAGFIKKNPAYQSQLDPEYHQH